jgi:hypothetical protein
MLMAAFPEPQFYLDEEAIRSAVCATSMFNLIDTGEGDKVDFWLLTADAFDQTRFGSRAHRMSEFDHAVGYAALSHPTNHEQRATNHGL